MLLIVLICLDICKRPKSYAGFPVATIENVARIVGKRNLGCDEAIADIPKTGGKSIGQTT